MNADSTGYLRYIQLGKSTENIPYYVVCIRLIRCIKTCQMYIFIDFFPADSIPEFVYFPRLSLLVGGFFEYGEILKRTAVSIAVIGGNADTATIKPNFCNFRHNRNIRVLRLFLIPEIIVPFGDDFRLV